MAEGRRHKISRFLNSGLTGNIILVLEVLAVVAAAGWLWMGTHALLPGPSGCLQVRSLEARESCVRTRVEKGLDSDGAREMLLELDRRWVDVPNPGTCHIAMHDLGRKLTRTDRIDKRLMRLPFTGNCAQGIMHGAMQELGGLPTSEAADRAREICGLTDNIGSYAECVHGRGHSLERLYGEQAEAHCAKEQYAELAPECVTGIYMQRELDGDDQGLCDNATLPVEEFSCYQRIASKYHIAVPRSTPLRELLTRCRQSQWSTAARAGCTYRMGWEDPAARKLEDCGTGSDQLLQSICAMGLVKHLAEQMPINRMGCPRSGPVALGCAAGAGAYDSRLLKRGESALATCRQRYKPTAMVTACVAGATRCWPDFSGPVSVRPSCPRTTTGRSAS